MAIRTDADAVKELMAPGNDYSLSRAPSLTRFIAMASSVVDRVETCAGGKDITLTDTELEQIECALAAHFFCMSDQTYASRSTGGASGSFHGQTGMYLEGTKYGQMALSLDYSGCLGAIASGNQRKTASMAWLGKPRSEQTPYDERD